MKNPLTPAGIEPATFLFVVQHLNHCATAVQSIIGYHLLNHKERESQIFQIFGAAFIYFTIT